MAIQEARESVAGDEDPLNSEEDCKVVQQSSSLYVCVTSYGQKTHSIEKGDSVTVHTYTDRIVIQNPREPVAGGEGPLNSKEDCKVVQYGTSLFVCVTSYGQHTHSIEKGDSVTVHTFADRIEIEPEHNHE